MRRFAFPVIVMVLLCSAAYQWLTTQRGAAYVAVAMGVPNDYEPYCDAARSELRTWLSQHGFAPEVSRGHRSSGAPKERVEWFAGRHNGSAPFHVVLIIPEDGRSSVHAQVEWFFHGFLPRVNASDRNARAFAEMLRDWGKEYERRHPLQKNAA